jgi:hypothetical protein
VTNPPTESSSAELAPVPAVAPAAPKRWQVGLRTLFLLMAAVAVWLALFVNRQQIAILETRIEVGRKLAHVLIIDDPKKVAVVKMDELWMDDNRWDVHLPPGQYRICLATRKVDDHGFPLKQESRPIPAGRHRLALELRQEGETCQLRVKCDGSELLAIVERKEWASRGSTGGGEFSTSEQLPADKPVVLYRRRYMIQTSTGQFNTPPGPTEGLLLWIEPMAGSKPSP